MDIQVIKKDGKHKFERYKIRNAIIQAQNTFQLPDFDAIDEVVDDICDNIVDYVNKDNCIPVEDIENIVMSFLYAEMPETARAYSNYKIHKEYSKEHPTEIEKVLNVDDEVALENGNKDARLSYIQSAYLAEIPSREEFFRQIPKACKEAHDKGAIRLHDAAYSIRPMANCQLLNLEELFKGCKINTVWINPPKSFRTACTVATQILSQVTAMNYGGITINLLHLAKFVDVSRQKLIKKYKQYSFLNDDQREFLIQEELNKEIKDGLQTFLYQNNTLCAGTGQAAFLSVSIWLNEDKKYKDDFKLVVKEFLQQRIDGMPDRKGFSENPNFPKILYFLDDDSFGVDMDTTKLAAECSAKRLTPDYMSVKQHIKLKGTPIPSMGGLIYCPFKTV